LIEGSGTADEPIANLTFSGLQFSYATWLGPSSSEGFSEIQAGYQVTRPDGYSRQALCQFVPNGTCPFAAWTQDPGNISLTYAHHVHFLNDDFFHLGAAALTLGNGAQDVEGCIFTDVASNGVQLGGVDLPLAPIDQFTARNRVTNNLFRLSARIIAEAFPSSSATHAITSSPITRSITFPTRPSQSDGADGPIKFASPGRRITQPAT